MAQQRLKAYLSLIQELLTCPSGEEWIRLRKHEDLVDYGLVQTMEQVATTLTQEGNWQAAKFLHNWAGQLHHILSQPATATAPQEDRSQAYLALIQALLEAPPQERQALIAANQALITPGLVHLMRQISAQMAAQGDADHAHYLNSLAEELGKLWLQQHQFDLTEQPPEEQPPAFETRASTFKPFADQLVKPPIPVTLDNGLPDLSPSPPIDKTEPLEAWIPASPTPDLWPDPWMESPAVAQPNQAVTSPPLVPTGHPAGPVLVESAASDGVLQRIDDHLAAIATALTQLNERLAHAAAPNHPLWHLEALEQAYQAGWVLTTEEVENLIQVKPKCSSHGTAFERGSWRFVKAGKLGTQMAWRVEKVNDLP